MYFSYPLPLTSHQGKLVPGAMFVLSPTASPTLPLSNPAGLQPLPWTLLSQFALGTAAVPGALPARQIARDGVDYAYRFAWDTVKGKYSWLVPDWSKFKPAQGWAKYGFVSLDGGCTDNEPVALARQTLEGLTSPLHPQLPLTPAAQPEETPSTGSGLPDKPWEKDKATRAIVLVDPLCEIPHNTPDAMNVSLASTLPRAVDMFKQTNRFATADICDFLHPAVHNRFLVAPKRTNPQQSGEFEEGADALCGEALGAFLGFLSPKFRHHDFMLGRYNCQAFLEGTFTLASTNPLFFKDTPDLAKRVSNRPSSTLRQPPDGYNGPVAPTGEYPIIPLCGSAADHIPEPQWPEKGALDPETLREPVQMRAGRIMQSFGQLLPMGWFQTWLLGLVIWWLKGKAADKFVEVVNASLTSKNL